MYFYIYMSIKHYDKEAYRRVTHFPKTVYFISRCGCLP